MRVLSVIAAAVGCTTTALADTYDSSSSSLAQHALQKVIQDASEIYGPYNAGGTNSTGNSSSRANWMSAYPDETLLTALNIPGLHDAATWNYSAARQAELRPIADLLGATLYDNRVYRCQQEPIASALDAGVRFLDLRYAAGPLGALAGSAPYDTTLSLWHGTALQGARADLSAVFVALLAWLDAHPSETLLVSLQYESGTTPTAANDAATQSALRALLLESPATAGRLLQVPAGAAGGLGTLGAARGRIIVVRRFDLDQLPDAASAGLPGIRLSPTDWTDNGANISIVYDSTTNATAYIEDLYEPTADLGLAADAAAYIAAKVDAVAAHLRLAAADETGSLFITFSSAEVDAADVAAVPEIMALGNGTDLTPDGGVNQQLLALLTGELKGQRHGVVVVDFWDEPAGLLDAVLGL